MGIERMRTAGFGPISGGYSGARVKEIPQSLVEDTEAIDGAQDSSSAKVERARSSRAEEAVAPFHLPSRSLWGPSQALDGCG